MWADLNNAPNIGTDDRYSSEYKSRTWEILPKDNNLTESITKTSNERNHIKTDVTSSTADALKSVNIEWVDPLSRLDVNNDTAFLSFEDGTYNRDTAEWKVNLDKLSRLIVANMKKSPIKGVSLEVMKKRLLDTLHVINSITLMKKQDWEVDLVLNYMSYNIDDKTFFPKTRNIKTIS